MEGEPFVSVIVPVYNGARYLGQCLAAIKRSDYPAYEIIVADDASTDSSPQIADYSGVRVVRLAERSGPAAARNLGAQRAKGSILFFVDSDVLLEESSLRRAVRDLLENPCVAAVFGSYDDVPAEEGLISQYKNLYHHFVHQSSEADAVTFWAGCGAVRKEVFAAVGGFDQERYKVPSIEDIELGCRIKQKGFQILLDKQLQAKHLKKWDLLGLLRTDIFNRAVPWSSLVIENGEIVNALNLKTSQRISAGLVGLFVCMLLVSVYHPAVLYLAPFPVLAVCTINRDLYSFFLKKRGLKFAVLSIPLHFIYYFYSSMVFLTVWFYQRLAGRFLMTARRRGNGP